MQPVEAVKSFLQHATQSASRSTTLQPLTWLVGILVSGLVLGSAYQTPHWILVIFAIFLCLATVSYLGWYSLFALRNPDLLRSETFYLQKLAIEKKIYGDSDIGMIEEDVLESPVTPPLIADDKSSGGQAE
jgi:hypothetical protein